jgi:hypothetical protein
MNDTLTIITQVATTISSLVALIVAWRALQISHDAQRNTIRESVFKWQFDAIREIFSSMNVFLEAYGNFEVDSKFPEDFNRDDQLDELERFLEEFDIVLEKYEFILPYDIYMAMSKVVSSCRAETTKLFEKKPVKTYKELFQLPIDISSQVNEFFGVEELTHENKKLIEKYAKKAKD